MNLQLRLSHPPPPKHHHPRKPGPSRLRRHARREEAQEAAEKAASSEPSANKETAEVAAQTENTAKETCDVAEQADLHVAAVPAAHHHHEGAQAGYLHPAVEAALGPPAAQAGCQLPVLEAKQLPQAVQARPWLPHHQPVHDALCPDLQFGVAEYLPRQEFKCIGDSVRTFDCENCDFKSESYNIYFEHINVAHEYGDDFEVK